MMVFYGLKTLGFIRMIDVKTVVNILWRPFVGQINTGSPVYFSFHRYYLFNIFKEEGIFSLI